ncbi:P22 coat protein - protein 5 domain protein [Actinacidiphila sp. bgisy167]|uniref:phage major capsid protein n=1 Tax=Actinacidiphila sp. bgisy167 TaxID=3413797 RepID=UPI003D72298D
MALTNFIPAVYAAATLTALDTTLAYGSLGVINREYEGTVSEYGGSVVINTVADPTIEDYVPYTNMTGGNAASTQQTMPVDQRKAWSLDIDDVDSAQARDDADFIGKVSNRAAHLLAKSADAYIAAQMAAAVTPGTEVTLTDPADAFDLLVDMRTALSEADVPVDGRWVVVTPKLHSMLLKDTRFVQGSSGADVTRSSGVVGQAAGFAVLESSQAPDGPGTGAGKLIIAGHALATTYADQISKVEALRHPDRFTDRLRGLHVYGAKVIRPTALVARDVIGA